MRKLNRSPVMDWLRKGIVAAISLGSVVMCGCGGPPVDPDRGVSGPRSLTIKCIGGEIRAEPSGVVYDEWGATHRFPSNSRVTLSINDIDRYPCPMCIHWHGGELDGTIQDGLTVTMDSDKQFRAVIQMGHLREPEVTYLMFLTYKDKGRLWVAPPGRLLSHGEMVSFDPGQGVVVRAIPDDGLSFVGYWADDVTGFWPERRLRMSRDTVLLAFFDEEDPLDPRLDADGIFDAWQSEYGLPTDAASGATDDPDKDGLTNAEEERAFTDPASADTDGDG
ncbi:MAG: hypothetical protein GY851_17705, partial [bacterium]|nr:hypothetical protein [bacterium]